MASQRKWCSSWARHTQRLAGLGWGEPELPPPPPTLAPFPYSLHEEV